MLAVRLYLPSREGVSTVPARAASEKRSPYLRKAIMGYKIQKIQWLLLSVSLQTRLVMLQATWRRRVFQSLTFEIRTKGRGEELGWVFEQNSQMLKHIINSHLRKENPYTVSRRKRSKTLPTHLEEKVLCQHFYPHCVWKAWDVC